MKLVINNRRPFTSTAKEIIEMMNALETTSNLKVNELICNCNLMEYTNATMIKDGILIIKEVANEMKVSFFYYLVINDCQNIYPDEIEGIKKINMTYYLKKPWEIQ